MKKLLLAGLFLFLFSGILSATAQDTLRQKFPIHIALLDESISLPNTWFLRYSYNPAMIVGTEYLLKAKKNYDLHLTGNVGFYYHKDWQAAIFLNTEFGYRYHLKRWSFYPRIGAGYSHAFATKAVYKYKDGVFQKVSNPGNPLLMASASLNVSFKLNKKANAPEIYITDMLSFELPFNQFTNFHQFVGIGYRFYPFNRS